MTVATVRGPGAKNAPSSPPTPSNSSKTPTEAPTKPKAESTGGNILFWIFALLFLGGSVYARSTGVTVRDLKNVTGTAMRVTGLDMLVSCSFLGVQRRSAEKEKDVPVERKLFIESGGKRITKAQLAQHGSGATRIWLSLLGHVFDGEGGFIHIHKSLCLHRAYLLRLPLGNVGRS